MLAQRFAADRLAALAQVKGLSPKPVVEALVVCTQNAGRSQTAAALMNHRAQGRVHVRTAGSQPGSAIDPAVVKALLVIRDEIDTHMRELLDELSPRSAVTGRAARTSTVRSPHSMARWVSGA
ncbi:low molecular weight phosphatase family protein [Sphaerisporangium dianthi]|uniref:Low molecular weight phosphatase family protein n=1 Tax=Sphaerisporangium dianthi TaxID=1436120 RepID=A0ABV9CLA1_9ACTN